MKLLVQIRRWFSSLALRYRFFILTSLTLVVVTFMVSSLLYSLYERSQIEESRRYSISIARSIVQNISSRTSEVENTILEKVRSFDEFFSQSRISEYQKSRLASEIASELYYLPVDIEKILIRNSRGELIIFDSRGRISEDPGLQALFESRTQELIDLWGKATWGAYEGRLLLSRAIFSPLDATYMGEVACLIDSGYLSELVAELIPEGFNLSVAQQGTVIYSQGPYRQESERLQKSYYSPGTEGYGTSTLEGDTLYHNTALDHQSRWSVFVAFSRDVLLSGLKETRMTVLFISLISLLAALLVAYLQSRGVTRSLATLTDTIRKIDRGNLSIRAEVTGGKEVAELAEDFNHLSSRLEEILQQLLEEKNAKQEAQLKRLEAEYQSLLSQLRPHFLYNALEAINSRAKLEKAPEASRLITTLGRLLRRALERGKEVVPLSEELSYCREYITFQNALGARSYHLEIDLEEGLEELAVPRFLLQPLIENSIIHGFKDQGLTDCQLVIEARRGSEGVAAILVADTGGGMDEKSLENLKRSLSDPRQADSPQGIGLVNIARRLRILYGPDYGLAVSSKREEGTVVTITLPAGATQ